MRNHHVRKHYRTWRLWRLSGATFANGPGIYQKSIMFISKRLCRFPTLEIIKKALVKTAFSTWRKSWSGTLWNLSFLDPFVVIFAKGAPNSSISTGFIRHAHQLFRVLKNVVLLKVFRVLRSRKTAPCSSCRPSPNPVSGFWGPE